MCTYKYDGTLEVHSTIVLTVSVINLEILPLFNFYLIQAPLHSRLALSLSHVHPQARQNAHAVSVFEKVFQENC